MIDGSISSKDDAAAPDAVAPEAAALEAAVELAPDKNNFLTWTHKNWNKVPFDLISFPLGQNPLKTKEYYAVAVFVFNSVVTRTACNRLEELTEAWEYTFGVALSNESLGNPPSTGPNAFSDEERAWCEQTRRFFSAGGGSRAAYSPSGKHGRRRAPSRKKGAPEDPAGGSPATPATARRAVAATAAPTTPASAK